MTLFTALRYGLSGLMLTACLAVTHPALAEMISFKAELKGGNEVPANDSKGTGTLTATYDTASKKLTWKGNYSGLTGPATMAHFHGPAEPFGLVDPSWQHPHELGTIAGVYCADYAEHESVRRVRDFDRRPGCRTDGRTVVR